MYSYEATIIQLIDEAVRSVKARPLVLGGIAGSGGGIGGPPGGYVGYIPQTRVAYDLSELSSSGVTTSASLLDNLNHIRYRIGDLEAAAALGVTFIDLDDVPVSYAGMAGRSVVVNATEDGLEFVMVSGSETTASGGHIIVYSGVELTPREHLVFEGAGVTVTDNVVSGYTVVTIPADPLRTVVFTVASGITVQTGRMKVRNRFGTALTIKEVYLDVGTAPTGAAIVVDIDVNGTTVFTTQSNRPEIIASGFSGYTETINLDQFAVNDLMTFNVDQVGSVIAGSDMTITVVLE